MGPSTILYGVVAVAGFGIITLIISKFTGSSKKNLLRVFKKDKKQEELQKEIVNITKEQKVIADQIKASEHASKETRKKITEKLQKAAVEIQETLKKDNLSEIDNQIDEDWKDL